MTLKVEFIAAPELEAETGEHPVFEECEVVAVWILAARVPALLWTRHVHRVSRHVTLATEITPANLLVMGPGGVRGRGGGGPGGVRGGGGGHLGPSDEAAMMRSNAYGVSGLEESKDGDHHHLNLASLAKHNVADFGGFRELERQGDFSVDSRRFFYHR